MRLLTCEECGCSSDGEARGWAAFPVPGAAVSRTLKLGRASGYLDKRPRPK
jgi:hypothetical protein